MIYFDIELRKQTSALCGKLKHISRAPLSAEKAENQCKEGAFSFRRGTARFSCRAPPPPPGYNKKLCSAALNPRVIQRFLCLYYNTYQNYNIDSVPTFQYLHFIFFFNSRSFIVFLVLPLPPVGTHDTTQRCRVLVVINL